MGSDADREKNETLIGKGGTRSELRNNRNIQRFGELGQFRTKNKES